jgi:hypothetical protein
VTRARALPYALAATALAIGALSGCATAAPPATGDAPAAAPSTAQSTAAPADPAICDEFNQDSQAQGGEGNWVPATADFLSDWGISSITVAGGCQDLSKPEDNAGLPESRSIDWYGDDLTVCDAVTAQMTDQLAAAGYTTSDQSSGDVIYLQSLSADGSNRVDLNCYSPVTAFDLSEGDLSITPNTYQEGKSVVWLYAWHPDN